MRRRPGPARSVRGLDPRPRPGARPERASGGEDEVFSEWDRRNKASQRDEPGWIPFAEHCRRSLAATYADLGLTGPVSVDAVMLLGSVAGWPLWPDVAAGLPALAATHRIGVLSNVDDDVFARTRVAGL